MPLLVQHRAHPHLVSCGSSYVLAHPPLHCHAFLLHPCAWLSSISCGMTLPHPMEFLSAIPVTCYVRSVRAYALNLSHRQSQRSESFALHLPHRQFQRSELFLCTSHTDNPNAPSFCSIHPTPTIPTLRAFALHLHTATLTIQRTLPTTPSRKPFHRHRSRSLSIHHRNSPPYDNSYTYSYNTHTTTIPTERHTPQHVDAPQATLTT